MSWKEILDTFCAEKLDMIDGKYIIVQLMPVPFGFILELSIWFLANCSLVLKEE